MFIYIKIANENTIKEQKKKKKKKKQLNNNVKNINNEKRK